MSERGTADVVVDTSLAVKWVLTEAHTVEAVRLLREWQARSIRRVVPSWFACEVANVFYRRIDRELNLRAAQVGVRAILNEVVVLDFDATLATRAMEYALAFGQRASYDAHYLALAERLGCELWTADRRFWDSTEGTLPWFRWLGEIDPS
jgi:predicted nucleic acid-binding protein